LEELRKSYRWLIRREGKPSPRICWKELLNLEEGEEYPKMPRIFNQGLAPYQPKKLMPGIIPQI